ncbi:hypothetical protein BD779DRAFT_1513239 [Infundibulicybe gibba]|nr:hypothetical protein BD779DRAFT_1513239 [Infundibulicybe gibba]
MHALFLPSFVLFLATSTCAKTVVINVGHNTTDNATAVFDPPTVNAEKDDVVMFNFTLGNHTVTQSSFASPCIPLHITNSTVNSFDSGFRDAGNATAITSLTIPIFDNTTTIWFYDANTCSLGGVGGINLNTSNDETLDGFVRNAIRLNGTAPPSSSTVRGSATKSASPAPTSNDAHRAAAGAIAVILAAIASVMMY